jgi:hypothetical protein
MKCIDDLSLDYRQTNVYSMSIEEFDMNKEKYLCLIDLNRRTESSQITDLNPLEI